MWICVRQVKKKNCGQTCQEWHCHQGQRSQDLIRIFYLQGQSSWRGTQQPTTRHQCWLHDYGRFRRLGVRPVTGFWTLWVPSWPGSHLVLEECSRDGDKWRRKAGPSSRIAGKTICFVNLMWTLQMCDGAEATSFYRLAISWVNMAPLPWPSKETLQREKAKVLGWWELWGGSYFELRGPGRQCQLVWFCCVEASVWLGEWVSLSHIPSVLLVSFQII